ncbi:Decaprenylphosphoryl-2-keto-beta-D-erythro-pentose reductase [BD1-7 clade bacterium]|uniref:Decaprenylphosphoryl-2-keto-beta-D-erythro-pentose reductase n=1 Tax=BD1-7 clade bacterium TaxID=2029982 RepID=A0A5S9QTW3_9GAMM|nr:Decaprenylphosphoryl-2-keto-beta-D-erythro-pentose reductase [BD1-7 clade bacterium]
MRVLVIGATSSVAGGVIRQWADRGATLFLVGRDESRLQAISEQYNDNVSGTYSYDFSDVDQASPMVDEARAALGQIDCVLLAQGYLPEQIETEDSYELASHTIDSNFTWVIAQIIPLVQLLVEQNHGSIGVITSVAGDRGRPRNYTYGAAKGGLSLYLQGLRSRLWSTPVDVITFKLGPVDTPMTASHEKNFSFSTVEQVAGCIVKAFDKPRGREVYVPGYWCWVLAVVRIMPEWLFQRLKFLSAR